MKPIPASPMMFSLSILGAFFPKQRFQLHNLRSCLSKGTRNYTKKDSMKSKNVVVKGTRVEERVRVRRARPADNSRIIRFVRENSRVCWPGLSCSPAATHIVLSDYVSRALSQGHSLIAEQNSSKGWNQILGLALGRTICPWDAKMLEKWAHCIRCSRTRKILNLTAHCLRAPDLHEKYRVHNMLQVILLVPSDSKKSGELVNTLVHNVLQRGKDVGFAVLRFDVSDAWIARALEDMQLKKEWQLNHETIPNPLKELAEGSSLRDYDKSNKRTMTVYTAFPSYQQ